MAITAGMVKELREMTGAGMMDCKKALSETNGDMDAAVEFLRKNGQAKAEKKAGRIAAEGIVKTVVKDDKVAAIVDVIQVAAVPAEILVEEPMVEEIAVEEPVVEEIVEEKPGVKRDTTINVASEPVITNPDSMENVKNENEDEEGSIAVENTDTGYLINAEGMICGLSGDKEVIKDGVLYFPEEGCSGIARGALSDLGSAVEEIEIPANITNIQPGAFVGLSNLGWIEADAANPAYVTVDGVLYTADGTVLLVFPAAWTGTFQVPESVKSFAESAFDGTNLECIDARSCTLEQTESIPETVKLLE